MIRTLALRNAQTPSKELPYYLRNRFKAKKAWPPDFTRLSSKQQFMYEKKYRRRSRLKYTKESWMKGVQIVKLGSVAAVLIYAVLFMDWKQIRRFDGSQPFDATRAWFWGLFDGFWSKDQVRRKNAEAASSPGSNSPRA